MIAGKSGPHRPSLQDRRSRTTRARICDAAISCLDEAGYGETTFARIQARAKVSRGAMTHHFPTKQVLVAATAMQILSEALVPLGRRMEAGPHNPEPVRSLITAAWDSVAGSPGGRAMVEILLACRTDRELHSLLESRLHDWDRTVLRSVARSYRGNGAAADDAELLWSICRSFLRGLILHAPFVGDPAYPGRMVDRFARIMETQLLVRPDAAGDAS